MDFMLLIKKAGKRNRMRKKNSIWRISYRYLILHIASILLTIIPLKSWGQSTGEATIDQLINMGFENVRWADTPNERVYTIENNAYKIQALGIAKAIDVIQRTGLPKDKSCKLIVTSCNIPQVSLTYRPLVGDTTQVNGDDWKVSYNIGSDWDAVKKEKKKNSSLFKVDILVYPQLYFRNYIITQIYQALLEFSPAVEVSLWPGMKFTGQLILPVYNDGYGGAAEKIRPGYITVAQKFRLPYNIQGTATVGIFDYDTYGADLALFYPLKDERFSLEGRIGYVGFGYWNGFKFAYNNKYTTIWSVGGNFYWPKYNTQFRLRGEQYLLKEKGVRFEVLRHFRYVTVGFYAVKAEYANTNGGFKFFVTLPPYKHKRHKYIPRVSTALGTGVTYNAGNENVYYKMPYSNASENMMQQNSFNPYFIKSELLNF